MRRDYERKCPIAVNDKFCSGAIRNQLESSIASRSTSKLVVYACRMKTMNQYHVVQLAVYLNYFNKVLYCSYKLVWGHQSLH